VDVFAGIDWGSQEHDVCVLDEEGRRVDNFRIAHSSIGFQHLISRLGRHGEAVHVMVAIERPDGRLVDRLLEAGHPVVPVKSNAIKAWRESEVLSRAKSDSGDAEIIAEYLRLRRHRLRELRPFTEETRALRAIVRTRDDLVKHRVAAGNQLAATLDAFWPGPKALFKDLVSDISLAFLQRYPTPASAVRLGERRMASFLIKQGYSGRSTAAQLVARLRAAPAGITEGAEAEARRDAVLALIRVLKALTCSIKELDRSIEAYLDEHPDGKIFSSLPRSGKLNAAKMLAEWGDCREAYDGPDSVAALAGAVPVTKDSGKYHSVAFRWACNKRFRNALRTFADNSRHASPWAAEVYRRARARGHDHPHAVRILARAWIRVIWRCWIDRTPYDALKHTGARKLAEEAGDPETARGLGTAFGEVRCSRSITKWTRLTQRVWSARSEARTNDLARRRGPSQAVRGRGLLASDGEGLATAHSGLPKGGSARG
jgi:transposase